jgi:hypothetical protein
MSNEFAGILYPTVSATCDAIAYEWMTAGGANNHAEIDELAKLGAQHHAQECIDAWEIQADESGMVAAFERFLARRPDRNE